MAWHSLTWAYISHYYWEIVYYCIIINSCCCKCLSVFKCSCCDFLSTQNCIHYCMSALQIEFPELSALAVKVGDDNDDDDVLLLSIILATLTSKDKTSEPDLNAHSNKRRSYTMEHFRWGKPLGDKIAQPKLRTQSNKRRSYTMEHFRWGKPFGEKTPKLKAHSNGRRSHSMEHFRWGKPPGCKRRPVKVFTSSPERGGLSEDGFPPLARRQLSKNEAKRDLHQESPPNKQLKRVGVNSKTHVPLGLQDRKAGTYRMSHFRWGSPAASKRNDGFMKLWQEKPRVNMLRNNIVKDIQRIMEQREGREGREEEVGG